MNVLIAALVSAALSMTNPTYSPDSSKIAFTRDNDLYIRDVASGVETRLTEDGNELILNGYASWVYYEEIFGRSSNYRAFWWSPDSEKLAFYRFDNTNVPMFPIFSPFGQSGNLSQTRYPKAGQPNPAVRIGMVDLSDGEKTVWADFDWSQDQYFGTPFWSADSEALYVSREPRRQNTLDVYRVESSDGSKSCIYHEEYPTWVEFINGMIFTEDGLYMARNFETGWEQIYFLSYDGKTFKRLTDGQNWGISLLKVDQKKGYVWFVAERDSRIHPSVYRVDKKGGIVALTDPEYYVSDVSLSEDGRSFTARMSNSDTPWISVKGDLYGKKLAETVSRQEDPGADRPHPELKVITNDGFDLYGMITYPRGFDPSRKYPVIMTVYGGPGTAYLRDRWGDRDITNQWCYENDIIYMVVDPRSSGENGRRGMDQAFRQMTVIELQDYIAWSKYMQSLPYVRADRIGVNGFSFGGTTTAMLVLRYPEYFSCGVAGGGVYDWHLYDSNYTERFMDTPQDNPEGYDKACVLNYVDGEKPYGKLRLTHGTGDDNVHFQNTLQLIDALQKEGIQFEMMIYPDGMHGYRGLQHEHDVVAEHDFWVRTLFDR